MSHHNLPRPQKTLENLGLGILSWRGYDSVRATLKTYQDAGFLDYFGEKLLFLPEIEDEGVRVAAEFAIPYKGTAKNLGILGGFKAMAENMTSEYLLLAENDFKLCDPNIDNFSPIARALESLQSGQSNVWRFRHLQNPGPQLFSDKTLQYWPNATASPFAKLTAGIKRILRTEKAHRMKGMSIYTEAHPSDKFPDVIKQLPSGDYLVRSDVLNWANNLFMIKRDFFLNAVIPMAEQNIGGRLINGFPTIETELNRGPWWREQKFWIGVSNPGIFTHNRMEYRGY